MAARRLDHELARGADPWSSTELMARASRLSSFESRRRIAGRLVLLAEAAAMPCMGSLYIATRRELILEHRDELLELAARLSEPEPVAVAVVADLARLVSDGCGPTYPGGGPPSDLAAVTARSLRAIA